MTFSVHSIFHIHFNLLLLFYSYSSVHSSSIKSSFILFANIHKQFHVYSLESPFNYHSSLPLSLFIPNQHTFSPYPLYILHKTLKPTTKTLKTIFVFPAILETCFFSVLSVNFFFSAIILSPVYSQPWLVLT